MRSISARWLICGSLLLATLWPSSPAAFVLAQQPAQPAQPEADARTKANLNYLDEVTLMLRRQFYDKKALEAKWPTIVEAHKNEIGTTETRVGLYGAINSALGDLKVSHLALLEGYVYRDYILPESQNTHALRPGFEIIRLNGKYFVATINDAGPAQAAGLLRGDEVLAVNDLAPEKNPDVLDGGGDPGIGEPAHYVVRVVKDQPLRLAIRRSPGANPQTLTVMPKEINLIDATAASAVVFEVGGKKLGYIHTWHFLHTGISAAVYAALTTKFKDCDALLLDVRGRGGSVIVISQMLAPFQKGAAPAGTPKWNKPVVALIDEGTRSAKEIFAHAFKRDALGPLVGRKTSGAVLATSFFPLSDGGVMMIPVMDARRLTRDNVVLEGVGVTPNFLVKGELPYAAGKDEILEASKKVALNLLESPAAPE